VIAVDAHRLRPWRAAHEALRGRPGVPRVSYRQLPAGGRARSLNLALEQARAPLVVFLADDFIVRPDFLERHLALHERRPEREVVGIGRALIPPHARRGPFAAWLESTGELFGVPLDDDAASVPEYFFYVGNASVKRELLDAAGRFDEDFPHHCWDDYDLALRLRAAGMRAELVPEANAVHEHPITLRERRRQTREAGESAAIAERKYPGPHPWLAPGAVGVWRWRAAAWKWRLAHLVTRREELRARHYDRSLKAAYAAGLRDGRRARRGERAA
jgi:GT2 family glycosyltransferase